MLRFILAALAALSTASAPVPAADQCEALVLPFSVPADLATDSELSTWLETTAEDYCATPANAASGWCTCYLSGQIDVAGL